MKPCKHYMPFIDECDHTAVWPSDLPLPENCEDGERRFNIETSGSGWSIIRKITALAVEKHDKGVTVYGDKSLDNLKESGYVYTGRVSVGGVKRNAFTSSQMFLYKGKLIDLAILYICKEKQS
jgi:hypothetical protein